MATGRSVELDTQHGAWAVGFARAVVESAVDGDDQPTSDGAGPLLQADRGAFVTLERGGSLRGCIGRPEPAQSGVTAIREAAEGAAVNDPRFPPVRPAELGSITVEVSVLTPPELISGDPGLIPERVEIGRDGLILDRSGRAGLLLPQVAVERGWSPREFLEKTCRKAGLPPDCWRSDDIVVERFTAQVFAEVDPRGPVEQVTLDPRDL